MFNCLLDVFEKFQTFLVGLLGFTGVIFTIWMNARLVRKQHDRKIMHERTALRTALIAELGALSKTYKNRIDTLRGDINDQSALIPEYVSNRVYNQLLDRIGLLTAEEIESVMEAYLLVAELPVRLRLISKDTSKLSEHSGYIHIDKEYAEAAAKIHDSFLAKINAALLTVQSKLEKFESKRKSTP